MNDATTRRMSRGGSTLYERGARSRFVSSEFLVAQERANIRRSEAPPASEGPTSVPSARRQKGVTERADGRQFRPFVSRLSTRPRYVRIRMILVVRTSIHARVVYARSVVHRLCLLVIGDRARRGFAYAQRSTRAGARRLWFVALEICGKFVCNSSSKNPKIIIGN